jgi:hypothetical protein
MIKGPVVVDLPCINCNKRRCFGKCDAKERCNCKEPCKVGSCNAHAQFRIMSIRDGAHPHYYSVQNYCPSCERLGCKCIVPSNVRYYNDNNYDGGEDSDDGYRGRDGGKDSDDGYSRGGGGVRNREDEW